MREISDSQITAAGFSSIPPKLALARANTPIQHLGRLSSELANISGRPIELYIKRDDLTHTLASGNKLRKLEFLLQEAVEKKTKVVFTCGGVQSNHARATAAICRELGLECVLFLRGKKPEPGDSFEGNLLLDRLFGCRVEYISDSDYEEIGRVFVQAAETYRVRDGKMPFFIPEGGSCDIGAMGYVAAFAEIIEQVKSEPKLPRIFDSIVVANGSGGTHAGLLLGRNLSNWEDHTNVVSFNVCRNSVEMANRVKWVMMSAIQRYRLPISFMADDIRVFDGYVGPGYGTADESLFDFIAHLAREDGLVLDPIYTGKAMFGLVSELKNKTARSQYFGNKILFVHTGGIYSLFAHREALTRAVVRSGK